MDQTSTTTEDDQPFDFEALRSYAERLAGFGGWSFDVTSGAIYWTPELFSLFGYDSAGGAPSYEVAISLYPKDQGAIVDAAVQACIADGIPMNLESVIVDRDGRDVQVRIVGEPILNAAGDTIRIVGAFYNISEIIAERETRIAAQNELRSTLDNLSDVVTFINTAWYVSFANVAATTLAGVSEDDLYTQTIWELFPGFWTPTIRSLYERAMDERVSGVVRDFLPDYGVWVEAAVHPASGGIASFVRDVTDEQAKVLQAEEALERLREQAGLLDASRQAIFTEDLDNVVTYWNLGAEEIYGWTKEEAIGRNIRDLIYDDTTEFEQRIENLLREGRWRGDMKQQTKDGRKLVMECNWQVVHDADGHALKIFAVNSDVTELRQQQAVQSRTQRMESLGTLAGGVAHDLNNVLTPLLMAVQLMKSEGAGADHNVLLEVMETGIKRGADMISQVVAFARGVEGERNVVDIEHVLHELSTLLLNTLPKSIVVVDHGVDGPLSVVGDATQILQVLMNLVANARDAMEGGGTMTVSARHVTITQQDRAATTLGPGTYARISIEDSGVGMSQDVLDKVFEPFFTTKDQDHGTGLGLASSAAMVKSHGGAITAYSEAGVGSSFTVFLPLAEGTAVRSVPAHAEPDVARGAGELVLVVDDEATVRQLVRRTLTAHGYEVVEARNGLDAIEVFKAHSEKVALILTDMMMPVMDGAATAAYFFEHHPHVAVVAASGLSASGGLTRTSGSRVDYFISKPFTTETLLRTVRTALDARSDSTGAPATG